MLRNSCLNTFSIVRHFRHARACSQCYQCGGRQSKEVIEQQNIFYVEMWNSNPALVLARVVVGGLWGRGKEPQEVKLPCSSTLDIKVMESHWVSLSSIHVEKLARLDEDPNCSSWRHQQWWHVEILHWWQPWHQGYKSCFLGICLTICGSCPGWPGASSGHVPALHRLRLHAPHLGQVQQVQWQLFRNIILYSCFPQSPLFSWSSFSHGLLFRA